MGIDELEQEPKKFFYKILSFLDSIGIYRAIKEPHLIQALQRRFLELKDPGKYAEKCHTGKIHRSKWEVGVST